LTQETPLVEDNEMKKTMAKLLLFGMATAMFSIPAYARKHEDVQNIGNRSVSGRIFAVFPNFVSLEKEMSMGNEIAAEFEQTAKLVEDPVVCE
jgi:hypothetical protein